MSSDGFNRFMVVQDRLSKLLEVVPCTDSASSLSVAKLLYDNWYLKGYGFPTSIVSDRDTRFLSDVWKEFSTLIGFTQILSVSRHQQTNGGAESMIKMFKNAIRRLGTYNGTNWTSLRSAIQFSYNNSIHSSTGFRPFYLAHAFTPQTFPSFNESDSILAKQFDEFNNNLLQAQANIHRSMFGLRQATTSRTSSLTLTKSGIMFGYIGRGSIGRRMLLSRPRCYLPSSVHLKSSTSTVI